MYNRLSINQQLNYLRTRNQQNAISIHFQKLIHKQQQVIQALQSELLLLKSYITLKGEVDQPLQQSTQQVSQSTPKHCPKCQAYAQQLFSNQALKNELAQILLLKQIDQLSIVNAVKELKELVNKQKEPIFVERVKQIKVPITIQKIIQKPVERIVEKIIYVDRPTVVFKQKVIQKFIQRKDEPSLNTSHSEKTIKIQRHDKEVQESKNYNNKYQTNYSRKPEYGSSNLIKKRQNAVKYYSKY